MIVPSPSTIRDTRLRAGLSQSAAARLLGVGVRSYKRYECENGNPVSARSMSPQTWELFTLKIALRSTIQE